MTEKKRESQIEFVRWFRKTAQNDDKILRVFDRKDYYCVYGKKNSQYIAREFYRSKESLRSYGSTQSGDSNDKIEYVHFRQQQFEAIQRYYVGRQCKTVEIYVRDTNTAKWKISKKITPSNISMNSMGDASFNLICVVMSINCSTQEKKFGICLCNHSSHSLEIAQFIEDPQYTKISHLFVAKGVKQCIFKSKSKSKNNKLYKTETEKFKNVLLKSGVQLINDMNNNKNNNNNNNETAILCTINSIINSESSKRLLTMTGNNNYNYSLDACASLILHEELLKDHFNFNRYKLSKYKINSFMRLDSSALAALNLFPALKNDNNNMHNVNNSDNHSLYGILKRCKSSMGDRLLSIWIRQPLTDINEIYRRQKLVKLFVENDEVRELVRDEHLNSLIDLEKLTTKLLNNKIGLKDLVELYYFVASIPWIKEKLSRTKNVSFHTLNDDDDGDDDLKDIVDEQPLGLLSSDFIIPMEEMEKNFNSYLAMIEQVVDLDEVKRSRQYLIKAEFDSVLDKFAKKKKKIMADMEACRAKIMDKLSETEKVIKLERHKSYGYCLRIQKSKANKIKKKNTQKKYIILSTQKGGTFFLPKDNNLRKLSKSYIDYEKKYSLRQKVIVDKCVGITKTYIPVISGGIVVFSELDVILSLAYVASHSPCGAYVLPKIYANSIASSKRIIMHNARHPCLELIQLDGDGGVIANSVQLHGDKSSFCVVTGPNMGGKSTYIRMIGLIVLMAQIGSYVPCDLCELTIIDSILARVGAGDNQLRGVSTFMAEMLESSSILEAATPNSLIIIDELGRGTSTYDGYGIAYSISQHIINELHSFCLFATHFHELAILEQEYKCVINKHVTAHFDKDDDSLTMLYKINDGPCPQSFGIQVAKLAKFPQSVIQTAKNKANQLESIANSSVSLYSYNSIQKILEKYKQIQQDVEKNNWNENDQQYIDSIKEFKTFIETKINQNPELADIAHQLRRKKKHDNNNKNNKMEID